MLAKQIKNALLNEPDRIDFFVNINSKLVNKLAEEMIPRTVGIEIEVENREENVRLLARPLSKHDGSELRFFLGKGLAFFRELHIVTKLLNEHSTINPSSGIHYQTFTYLESIRAIFYGTSNTDEDRELNKELQEYTKLVNHWNYTGSYNSKTIGLMQSGNHIMRVNSEFHTWEIRIGEMTFDYNTIVKRSINTIRVTKHIEKNIYKAISKIFSVSKLNKFKEKVDVANPPSTKFIGVNKTVYRTRLKRVLFGK